MNMGIVVEVAGRKMQEDFEPVLERQIHYFVNGASGIQHVGQRDITWIRFSKAAVDKGFELKNIGDILYARFHAEFGAIVDKVQVTLYTDPEEFEELAGQGPRGLPDRATCAWPTWSTAPWRSSTAAPCARASRPTTSA